MRHANNQITFGWRAVSFFVALGFIVAPLVAADHKHGPTGAYTEWNWPDAPHNADGKSGFYSVEHRVTPEIDPGKTVGYFWSHQVALVDGGAAYFGLQTLGRHPDGTEGKVAIFSVWNALDARGNGIAQPFDSEGEGFQTLIPYEWKVGRTYRLRMFRSGKNRNGTEWSATVREVPDGKEMTIGTITVPRKWGYLSNWSVMWLERYTGPEVLRCSDVGYSRVSFSAPTANNGEIAPVRHRNYLTDPPNCPNSRVRTTTRGFVQEMGYPR